MHLEMKPIRCRQTEDLIRNDVAAVTCVEDCVRPSDELTTFDAVVRDLRFRVNDTFTSFG